MQEDEREEIRRLISEELARNGLDPKHCEENADLLRWSRRHMQSFESAGSWVFRSVVLAMATGLVLAVWEGIKQLVKSPGQ